MANLSKPKEATPSKFEEARPPESLEEKRKRLRKEERRKLRVSFKPDHSLVSIREFVHDPEEEMGHEDSMVRDVGDSRGEGQMLKMHKDLDVMDEDEDSSPAEETLAPWVSPSREYPRYWQSDPLLTSIQWLISALLPWKSLSAITLRVAAKSKLKAESVKSKSNGS